VTQVIVLNGGWSSGTSRIARCLPAILPDPWLTFGIDGLIEAMPAAMTGPGQLIARARAASAPAAIVATSSCAGSSVVIRSRA
jgi:chloramphenicol 3-O-phosphotransferase